MSKDRRTHKDDIFQPGARLRARHDDDKREMHYDAARATTEEVFQPLVAAVAVIAHADGRLDLPERRALVEAFITNPAVKGFSVSELAQELAEHSRTYGYDPHLADQQALSCLSASVLSIEQRQSIRLICHQVIMADGFVHTVELGALHRIEGPFGIAGGSS